MLLKSTLDFTDNSCSLWTSQTTATADYKERETEREQREGGRVRERTVA